MFPELMEFLACPDNQHYPLRLDAKEIRGDGEIQSGTIHCPACGNAFEIRESIPCFVSSSDDPGTHKDEAERRKAEEQHFRDQDALTYDSHVADSVALAELKGLTTLLKLEQNHTLLDLGCGTGRLTVALAEKARLTVGVDFSFESLKVFQKRLRSNMRWHTHLVQADIFHLPLRNQVFHRVVSNSVFQHLPGLVEGKAPVLEAARVLEDGGLFVLSIYNHSSTRAFLARLIPILTYGEGYEQDGFHAGKIYFRRYRWRELKELLSVSFEVEQIAGMRIIPKEILKRGGRVTLFLEGALQRSTVSKSLGYYVLASCRKKV